MRSALFLRLIMRIDGTTIRGKMGPGQRRLLRAGLCMTSDKFVILDERFARLFTSNAQLYRLYTGCRWAEGPAYFPAGRYLIWSDIPNNRMLRYDETTGTVGVFRQPAGYTNGHTVDRDGR